MWYSIGDLRESGGLDDLLDELSQSSLSIIISAIEQLALSRHPLSKKKLKIDLLLVKQHLELDHKGLGLLSETTNLRVAVVELGLIVQLHSEVVHLGLQLLQLVLLVFLLECRRLEANEEDILILPFVFVRGEFAALATAIYLDLLHGSLVPRLHVLAVDVGHLKFVSG
ncbi:hypothetical protein PRIPAC_97521 [Pristionchus pacificus]|uniref:Uncharacterized protein n=1 Tax=Pristionchus pacificus TaxID=54126 RepID=A0A2A6B2Q6_PRIPA|nr:hypothetical protein PRIPAC_97521 [Pristionchus pacificus]|eukprot:PDM60158.1 hypothetical protein PRIPAC_53983 [Pristionchus pacificus]